MPVIHGPQFKKHSLRNILKFSEKLIYSSKQQLPITQCWWFILSLSPGSD